MCAQVSEEELKPLLKKFVQLVAHTFYPPKEFLFIDLLVKNTILSEEDLAKKLHSEARQLRSVKNQFERDKLIREKIISIPKPEGRPQKISYYYIDYQMFVNVVRYRLFKMGDKLELEERGSERTNYLCTKQYCFPNYTDLDMDKLLNSEGNLVCERCGSLVEEEEKKTQSSTINSIAKLNLQLKPIYDLLKQFKDSTVPNDMVEPSLTQDYMIATDSKNHMSNSTLIATNSDSMCIGETKHHKKANIPSGHPGSGRDEANATEALARGENIHDDYPMSSFKTSPRSSDAAYSDDNSNLGMIVRGTWYQLEQLKDLVTRMSDREKKEYSELCRQAYEDYYD
ncbi:General transcription factor IIE subunit 1 [Oopsacas minuta]|uniref:General transcription factor IIE subunit 1 n=1 Tax=Oopsacas minuta TaxID=111878 RepID=A0AAV7JSL7_9METZ|nr:General transcription factor IIE subunit 1 [Oopsacas minuta]